MDRRTVLRSTLLLAVTAPAIAEDKAEKPVDPAPLENELEKYPRCVICNMDRRKFHYARHLLHYGDGHVEGTCSINCAAECMLKERRRGYRAIYAPDYGTPGEPKLLIDVSVATYLIGSDLRGVMSPVSKYAFADAARARKVQEVAGGQIADFPAAIKASFEDMAGSAIRRYDGDRERLKRARGEG